MSKVKKVNNGYEMRLNEVDGTYQTLYVNNELLELKKLFLKLIYQNKNESNMLI